MGWDWEMTETEEEKQALRGEEETDGLTDEGHGGGLKSAPEEEQGGESVRSRNIRSEKGKHNTFFFHYCLFLSLGLSVVSAILKGRSL